MCIDSLIVINSLSLATFLLFVALLYTGKAAKLKLFIIIRESIHIALSIITRHWTRLKNLLLYLEVVAFVYLSILINNPP